MNFSTPHTLYLAYALSNIAGLVLLWAAIKKPKLARLFFFLLFGWACWVNLTTCFERPDFYLQYADSAIGFYARFIRGWFSNHITAMVGTIAIGQGLIAVSLWLKAPFFRLACIGIIIFLLAIAPLEIYAAFPFSLTVAAAAWILSQKEAQVLTGAIAGNVKIKRRANHGNNNKTCGEDDARSHSKHLST